MSVTVTYESRATVKEVLETNTGSSATAGRTVTHDQFNSAKVLNGTSTPPCTKVAAFTQALTAGAATIDLTALVGANGVAVDGTGLKLQVLRVKNLGANDLTITPGVSSGYAFAGAASKIILGANDEALLLANDTRPDVAAGVKNIDLAGTLVQTSQWTVILG
jgi:hypothetical protein